MPVTQEELKPNEKCVWRAAGFKPESTRSEMTASVGKTVTVAEIRRRKEINVVNFMW